MCTCVWVVCMCVCGEGYLKEYLMSVSVCLWCMWVCDVCMCVFVIKGKGGYLTEYVMYACVCVSRVAQIKVCVCVTQWLDWHSSRPLVRRTWFKLPDNVRSSCPLSLVPCPLFPSVCLVSSKFVSGWGSLSHDFPALSPWEVTRDRDYLITQTGQ